MILTIILAIAVFAMLIISIVFLPKIKIGKFCLSTYWIIALFGAILMFATLRVSISDVGKALFNNDSSMNPIKILVLFFSMTFISIFLEEAGFFRKRAGILGYSIAEMKASQKFNYMHYNYFL